MKRSASGLANVFLMALMLLGVWLANHSGTSRVMGLLLALGSAAGLIFLARRENSLPLGRDERETWEIIRAKGKHSYILRSIRSGLFAGFIFLLYQLIRSRWSGEPLTASSGFVLVAFVIILYIGGSYYAAIRNWALYEERYKESSPQGPQHNNGMHPTADTQLVKFLQWPGAAGDAGR